MTTATHTATAASTLRDLISLAKPRVSTLVIATAAAGIWVAPGSISPARTLWMLLGTVLVVAGANVLNCWMERESDARMHRTRDRALPGGRLDPTLALVFGVGLSAVALPMLHLRVNGMTAGLAALALLSYVLVYTPLKSVSPSALIVGAVPGALPPLMGWTAVTGSIDPGGLVLFGILFLWQMPHVLGLSCYRRSEYEAAGIKVLPAVRGDRVAKWHALLWALLLLPVSLLLAPLGLAGPLYVGLGGALGLGYLAATVIGFRRDPGPRWGRRLFLVSLLYLPALFAVLMLDPGVP